MMLEFRYFTEKYDEKIWLQLNIIGKKGTNDIIWKYLSIQVILVKLRWKLPWRN